MRAKWLFTIIGGVLLAGAASAATVDCTTLGTLYALEQQVNGTTSFCQIGDVLITGVSSTNLSMTAEENIDLSVNNNPALNQTMAERGFNFNGQGSWGMGTTFSITFSGVLCYQGGSNPNCVSGVGSTFLASPSTVLDEGQAAQTNPDGSTVTATNSITPTGQGTLSLNTTPGTSGAGSDTVQFYNGTTGFSLTVSDNGQGQLNTLEGDVEELVGPEPSTMILMGGALLGLGAVSRRLRKKA